MSQKIGYLFIIALLSVGLLSSCGGEKEGKGKKSKDKTEQTADAKKDKGDKGDKAPAKASSLSLPAENDNDEAASSISGKKWKLTQWQRSGKKSDKAPAFVWSFDDNGSLGVAVAKGKTIKGKWAYTAADKKMYLALPGSKKKGSALDAFASPFDVESMSDSEIKIKNAASALVFKAQ